MQKKKGISLIVLVITIIVMIILASAIIITLSNTGVINKANEAVDSSNDAAVKQIASLAWAEAYADGKRTDTELKEAVVKALEDNNLEPEDYYLNVTASGVTIKKGWVKKGFTVKKGNQVLEIGDVVNYDAGVSTYTGGWKVLGADDNGNLLIMSAGDVSWHRLGYEAEGSLEDDLTESQNDWLNGAKELDGVCEPYGKGKGAVSARSITIEDVDAVTGYDPTTYGKGTIKEYGNTVTYKYNGTTKPAYAGSNGVSGTLTGAHADGFRYYNGEEFVNITDLTTGTSGSVFAELRSNGYSYDASKLTTINKETNAKAYQMLLALEGNIYWLASPYITTNAVSAAFGMYIVSDDNVGSFDLLDTSSLMTSMGFAVRAVVTLSSDINFTGSSASGWSY